MEVVAVLICPKHGFLTPECRDVPMHGKGAGLIVQRKRYPSVSPGLRRPRAQSRRPTPDDGAPQNLYSQTSGRTTFCGRGHRGRVGMDERTVRAVSIKPYVTTTKPRSDRQRSATRDDLVAKRHESLITSEISAIYHNDFSRNISSVG